MHQIIVFQLAVPRIEQVYLYASLVEIVLCLEEDCLTSVCSVQDMEREVKQDPHETGRGARLYTSITTLTAFIASSPPLSVMDSVPRILLTKCSI